MHRIVSSLEAFDEFLLARSHHPDREPLEKLEGALKLAHLSSKLLQRDLRELQEKNLPVIDGMTEQEIRANLEVVENDIEIWTRYMGSQNQELIDQDAAYAARLQAEEDAVRPAGASQPSVAWVDQRLNEVINPARPKLDKIQSDSKYNDLLMSEVTICVSNGGLMSKVYFLTPTWFPARVPSRNMGKKSKVLQITHYLDMFLSVGSAFDYLYFYAEKHGKVIAITRNKKQDQPCFDWRNSDSIAKMVDCLVTAYRRILAGDKSVKLLEFYRLPEGTFSSGTFIMDTPTLSLEYGETSRNIRVTICLPEAKIESKSFVVPIDT